MIKFKMLTDPTNISPGEKSNYLKNRRDMAEYRKVKSETYSLWCDILYKLSIANHFRDEIMYFPHNIDFRGRVYPIAPHFHHMGGDLSRSLLKFAKGRPLGPKGLDWLKIHCINLTELKKKFNIDLDKDLWEAVNTKIICMAGVVDTGLFVNMAKVAYFGDGNGQVTAISI